nr:MAG TPA: hypothetical protein [Caudoviricetes sp.]
MYPCGSHQSQLVRAPGVDMDGGLKASVIDRKRRRRKQ